MPDHDHPMRRGPQRAYRKHGFGGVWDWCTGHGARRWRIAAAWARRKAKRAKDPKGFRKAHDVYKRRADYLHKLHEQHQAEQEHEQHALIVVFDGERVPKWLADILGAARRSGLWKGACISGIRTVAESIGLCQAICGHDSCPGTCAGASTNHTAPPTHTGIYPEGAADCTDPAGLEAYCRKVGAPLYGDGYALPNDVNHFSHTGH